MSIGIKTCAAYCALTDLVSRVFKRCKIILNVRYVLSWETLLCVIRPKLGDPAMCDSS